MNIIPIGATSSPIGNSYPVRAFGSTVPIQARANNSDYFVMGCPNRIPKR